ncbi:GTP-binding protein [Microbulbifer aggregans]|uniref:GTP-binding protein n=1 Tax=Microbulbifer aggregans TaxID=1769779 RepID=UPI001CFED664
MSPLFYTFTLPASLLRAKGVLHLAEKPSHRTIYQRVAQRWRYTNTEPCGKERPHSSQVLIGPAGVLDQSTLTEKLDACRVDSEET